MMGEYVKKIKAPSWYNPEETTHAGKLNQMLQSRPETKGWEIYSYEEDGTIALRLANMINQVEMGKAGNRVRLDEFYKNPTKGKQLAALYEDTDGFENMKLTMFDPFMGWAEFKVMTPDEQVAREALANAMGVNVWEVGVTALKGGGFYIKLPAKYSGAKHTKAIDEAITTKIGKPGWYLRVNGKKLEAQIVSAEPATFPAMFPITEEIMKPKDLFKDYIGFMLPTHGDEPYEPVFIDWANGAIGIIAGTMGSGKSVTINDILAQEIAKGSDICICDVPDKAVDYNWCKQYVKEGMWGCNSLEQTFQALVQVEKECNRRSKILKEADCENWRAFAKKHPDKALKPLFMVCDELMAMLTATPAKAINSMPKDDPDRVQAEQDNALKGKIYMKLKNLPAQYRFVGIRVLLATQVTTKDGAIGTDIRNICNFKMLQGLVSSKSQKLGIFSDVTAIPGIPDNIVRDPNAGMGVGTYEFAGFGTGIYKSLYASPDDLKVMIRKVAGR